MRVKWAIGAGALLGVWSGFGAQIAADGKTDYSIRISADAAAPDRFAAEELKVFLEQSTGAIFPIVSGTAKGKTLEVGTVEARRLIGADRVAKMAEEECAYAIAGDKVGIVGCGAAGNAYGVYAFLEREIGCRWFMGTGETRIPKRSVLDLADTVHAEKPRLPYRMILTFGNDTDSESRKHLFLFRNRINQIEYNFENLVRKDLVGKLPVRMRENNPNCHSFFRYLPPEGKDGYFKDHPEYYSLWNGKRTPRQLCFSNPEMRRVLTENFFAYVRSIGGKGFLDLSQMDFGGVMCMCDGCRALTEKYVSTGGPLFDYLFELSPKAKAAFPNLVIHFLAYHRDSTQPPPKVDKPFPDNLAAVFAPLDDDFSKGLGHPNNEITRTQLRRWCEICRVWTWSYPQVYAPFNPPYGGLGRTAEDLNLSVEFGITGSYHEHDVGTDCGANFTDLQTWVLLQQLRDPDLDWRELRREFCEGCYGEVAADVIDYEEFLERGREAMTGYLSFMAPADECLTPVETLRWQNRFDAMERKTGADEELVQRLREVRIGLDMRALAQWREIRRLGGSIPFTPQLLKDRLTATFDRAIRRRYTRTDKVGDDWRKAKFAGAFPRSVETLYIQATAELKALPDELREVPKDKIVQIFPSCDYRNIERVEMKDAAAGFALVERNVPVEMERIPYPVGFYDRMSRKSLLTRKIAREEIVPNEFHLYRIGRAPVLSSESIVWIGPTWCLSQYCMQVFRPGMDEEWDIYVSLKFEGPDYDPKSVLKESGVYFDRLVFVGPFAK